MKKKKSFYIKIGIIGVIIISCGILLWFQRTENMREAASLADKVQLDDKQFVQLKKGYYCGEGGIDCGHENGYIYYSEELTEDEAMEKTGFQHGAIDNEWDNGAEHAKIMQVKSYQNGSLLWYIITGAA